MKKHAALFVVPAALALASCGTVAPGLSDGVLTIGLECGYAPFNWTTTTPTDTSRPIADSPFLCDGYDVRIATYLADELDVELQIRKIDWDGLIPSLNAGSIDAIIAGMTDTAIRREVISFSQPYFETRSVMMVLPTSPLANATSVADFAGAVVVAQAGTIQQDLILSFADSDGWIAGNAFPTYPDALNALLAGAGVDAILAEEPFANQILSQQGNVITVVDLLDGDGEPDEDFLVTVSVGVRRNDLDLLAGIEAALDALSEATRLQWMAEASIQATLI
jgi:ABC-type amino acid transport substrate-binding protein